MNVIFDDLANEEFNDAVEYYEFQVEELGKRFKEEIKRALGTIKRFPEIGIVEEEDKGDTYCINSRTKCCIQLKRNTFI